MEAKNFKQEQLHSVFCRKLAQGQNMRHLTEMVHQWQNDGVAIGRRKTSNKVQGDIAAMLLRSSGKERPLNPTREQNQPTAPPLLQFNMSRQQAPQQTRAVRERSFAEVATAIPAAEEPPRPPWSSIVQEKYALGSWSGQVETGPKSSKAKVQESNKGTLLNPNRFPRMKTS